MARERSADVRPEGETGESLAWLWRSHLPLLATAALLLFVLVKVLAVSHGDLTTAIAVLGGAGPAAVGLSVALVFGLPFVSGIFAGALGVLAAREASRGRFLKSPVTPLLFVFTIASIFLLPPSITVATVVLLAAMGLLGAGARSAVRRGHRHRLLDVARRAAGRNRSPVLRWVLLFALFPLILFACSDTMWLPAHVLQLANGAQFTGYVLDESDDYIIILRERDRSVARLERSTVEFVELCRPRGLPKAGHPFLYRFDREPDARYPACDDVDRSDDPPASTEAKNEPQQ